MTGMICSVCRSHKYVFLFLVKTYHQNCLPFGAARLIYGIKRSVCCSICPFTCPHVFSSILCRPSRFPFPVCLRSFLCCMHLCFIYVICILRRLVSNTLMLVSLSRNLTSHTIGSGTDNPSGTRAFTLDIQWDSR